MAKRNRHQQQTNTGAEAVLENIEDSDHLVDFVKYSGPPKIVFCHYGAYDCLATIWWDYQSKNNEVLSWEVRRYRLDVISKSYLQKGSQIYQESVPRKVQLESFPLYSDRFLQFILFDLEHGHHYKFTVSAINAHGRSYLFAMPSHRRREGQGVETHQLFVC
jgi:hypothetical protein